MLINIFAVIILLINLTLHIYFILFERTRTILYYHNKLLLTRNIYLKYDIENGGIILKLIDTKNNEEIIVNQIFEKRFKRYYHSTNMTYIVNSITKKVKISANK